jgi:hypothetical protein
MKHQRDTKLFIRQVTDRAVGSVHVLTVHACPLRQRRYVGTMGNGCVTACRRTGAAQARKGMT